MYPEKKKFIFGCTTDPQTEAISTNVSYQVQAEE